jgi:hypothetical protein
LGVAAMRFSSAMAGGIPSMVVDRFSRMAVG